MISKNTLLLFGVILFLSAAAVAADDIEQHRSCAQCGMDRKAYGYSRMVIQYEDGSTAGVCSLHCAVLELGSHPDKSVKGIFVADRSTRMLIDAKQAVWVIGGSKRGVMTQVPKWAFETQASAADFVKPYGGKIVTWEETMTAAKEEIAKTKK